MIRGDQVDPATQERAPQELAVRAVADRRGAFEQRPFAGDVGLIEHEIVRAGLDRDVGTGVTRETHRTERLGRRQMHDMQPRAGLARGSAGARHRADLRLRRPGGHPGKRVAVPGVAYPGGRLFDERIVLGVHRDKQPRRRRGTQRRDERRLGERSELGDPAVTEERLAADRPARGELGERHRIGPGEPAPEGKIDDRATLAGGALSIERCSVEDRRERIQGHVDHRRRPSGGRGAAAVLPAFPRGATGIVEMDMRIDDAREREQAGGVDLGASGAGTRLGERAHPAIGNEDVAPEGAVRDDHRAADREIGVRGQTSSIVKSCAPSQSVSFPTVARCSFPSVTVAK